MTNIKGRIVLTVMSVLLVVMTPFSLAASTSGPIELTGDIDGAAYVIRVPEDWNGTLLVYAHGYSMGPTLDPDAAYGGDTNEQMLLDAGYALAASGFRNWGFNVEEGIKDTRMLVSLFRREVGKPDAVILYGISMGTVIALESMEKYLGYYDGALSMCSLGVGSPRHWDAKLDYALAYATAFGWPESWGEVGDVRDDIDFYTDVYPKIADEFMNPLNFPANFGLFEFVRLVSGMPMGGFYQPAGIPVPAVILNQYLTTYGRAELERRAGGPIAQNVDHVYRLDAADTAYLQGLGVDVAGLLAEMNAHTNITAPQSARTYLQRFVEYNGQLHAPVVMLHTIEDSIIPVEQTSAYLETVTGRNNEDLLVLAYTNSPGHCNFSPAQFLTAIQAVEAWIDTGVRPDDAAFPQTLGFVPGYVADPWPQPPSE